MWDTYGQANSIWIRLHVDVDIFEPGKKKLLIQKYPDTWGRGLNYINLFVFFSFFCVSRSFLIIIVIIFQTAQKCVVLISWEKVSTTQREKINVPLLLSKACSKLSRQNNRPIKCKASSKVAQRQAYCCLTIDCVDLQFYRHRLEIRSKLTWIAKIIWALNWKPPYPELRICKDISQKGTFREWANRKKVAWFRAVRLIFRIAKIIRWLSH